MCDSFGFFSFYFCIFFILIFFFLFVYKIETVLSLLYSLIQHKEKVGRTRKLLCTPATEGRGFTQPLESSNLNECLLEAI